MILKQIISSTQLKEDYIEEVTEISDTGKIIHFLYFNILNMILREYL